jgi:ZIP family zinc transporter
LLLKVICIAMVETGNHVAVAFGLVLGAALSTGLGAAVVFFPSLVKLASKRVLASSLAFAAGVMIYVSLIEIFQKANSSFIDAGHKEGNAHLYTALCFFGGILIMMGLNALVNVISGDPHGHGHGAACSDDPVGELEEWQEKAEKEEIDRIRGGVNGDEEANKELAKEMENKSLIKMGLSTALAIALHNFPEGLATFVAALDDPKVGAVLAIALGIHNIPEGLCVSLPVYYATGNRLKGFFWGFLSGMTEPIGALIGWVVLANIIGDNVYAILFGLVSGMMTYISMKELIPTALKYDPKDTVVTHSVVVGMFVMGASLVMFAL